MLYPHNGGALTNLDGTPNPKIRRKAEEFNNPIMIVPFEGINKIENQPLLNGEPLLQISPSNVNLGALKSEEWSHDNSIVLRFFEACGLSVSAEVKIHPEIAEKILEIEEIDLLERSINQAPNWNEKKGILKFKMNTFELRTFKIVFK
jgi:alpha-mannosidase